MNDFNYGKYKSQSDAALLLLNTVVQTNQSSNRRCGRQQKLVLEFHSSRVTIGTYQMGRSIGLDRVGQPLMESRLPALSRGCSSLSVPGGRCVYFETIGYLSSVKRSTAVTLHFRKDDFSTFWHGEPKCSLLKDYLKSRLYQISLPYLASHYEESERHFIYTMSHIYQ